MDSSIREFVRNRAQLQCEYCQLPEKFSPVARHQVEHIVPRKHGGSDDFDNLALACIDCNLHKGTNLTGIDPETNEITELFHPRQSDWVEHFAWNVAELIGRTACGRTTIRVLDINGEARLELRLAIARLE